METEFVSIGFCCVTISYLKPLGYGNNGYPFDWLFSSIKMVKLHNCTNVYIMFT